MKLIRKHQNKHNIGKTDRNEGKLSNSTIIARHFNTALSIMDRAIRHD